MNANNFETREFGVQGRARAQDQVDNRHGVLGLIMLVSLAIPALLIRNLFPDLDPLLLAGFGVAIYSAYLVVMIAVLWRQETEAQSTVRVAPARVEQE